VEVLWSLAADEAMGVIEREGGKLVVAAIWDIIDRLGQDPFNRLLHTQQFASPAYGQVRATPTRYGQWVVLWQLRSDEDEGDYVVILAVVELPWA
jgi:hypothetical protein